MAVSGGRVRCLICGLGAIGKVLAREVLNRKGLEWVGAVDVAPPMVGRDVADVLGLDTPLGITVRSELDEAIRELHPDVVLHTTASYFPDFGKQIETIVSAGCPVVSSSEQLSFLPLHHRDGAWALDRLAKEKGVAVLGTGVNPGYVMDRLVVDTGRNCTEIAAIRVRRIVNASLRREPLQRKIGAGMTAEAFREKAATGRFGHAGFQESVALIAHGFGWSPVEVTETLEPKIADEIVETDFVRVEPGQAAGIDQRALGVYRGRTIIDLVIQMYVGAKEPEDVIEIDGTPDLRVKIAGGIFGDGATVGRLLSGINEVLFQPPGLRSVLGIGAFDNVPDPMPIRGM
jgi:4-hydroxy-tetrahydrodipicolinate reductase